ncbi:MAG: hypothetical protein ACRENJ_06940, partial [Candidatus Eiseniibacteriota bacterium]
AHLVLEAARAAPAAEPGRRIDTLGREFQRALRRLGVATSGADLVRAWDRGFLDGQRTEDWA